MLKIITCINLIFSLLLSCLFPNDVLIAQQLKKTYTIAILDLDAKGVSDIEAEVLSDKLRSHIMQLVSSEKYKKDGKNTLYEVVEREQMDKIFSQFEIQNTGCVSDSCAIEFGKMLQVDRIIVGTIGRVGNTYSVACRIVDIETARAIATADRQYKGKIEKLLGSMMVVIGNELIIGKKKKSGKKLYYMLGIAAIAGGTAAILGGESGGGNGDGNQLPGPPSRP